MAGKKGQKWSRPMTPHQRDAIALTKIEKFLDKQIDGELQDWSPTRLKALEIRYNKLRPALSAVDNTVHSTAENETPEQMMAKLQALLAANPHIIRDMHASLGPKAVSDPTSTTDTPVPTAPQQDVA